MNFRDDHDHATCSEIIAFAKRYLTRYEPLYRRVPNFDQLWESLSSDAKTAWRRTKQAGAKIVFITDTTPYNDALDSIWKSKAVRHDRAVSTTYTGLNFRQYYWEGKWPVPDYAPYLKCENHRLQMWGVEINGKLVAYAELVKAGEAVIVHSTMCHGDYLALGVQKYLFVELLKYHPSCHFFYGTADWLSSPRRHFNEDLGITLVWKKQPFMPQAFVLDFDDLECGKPGLEELLKLKEHYPNLKVTCFMVPLPGALLKGDLTPAHYREWADFLRAQDWIEICPHGFAHQGFEMRYKEVNGEQKVVDKKTANLLIDASEKTFTELGLPFQKIWKSPHWESSEATLFALWERGYTIACDPYQAVPIGGPVYLYDWSIDQTLHSLPIVHGHGHLFPPSRNAINLCLGNLLTMPEDAEFQFVSEVV